MFSHQITTNHSTTLTKLFLRAKGHTGAVSSAAQLSSSAKQCYSSCTDWEMPGSEKLKNPHKITLVGKKVTEDELRVFCFPRIPASNRTDRYLLHCLQGLYLWSR